MTQKMGKKKIQLDNQISAEEDETPQEEFNFDEAINVVENDFTLENFIDISLKRFKTLKNDEYTKKIRFKT